MTGRGETPSHAVGIPGPKLLMLVSGSFAMTAGEALVSVRGASRLEAGPGDQFSQGGDRTRCLGSLI